MTLPSSSKIRPVLQGLYRGRFANGAGQIVIAVVGAAVLPDLLDAEHVPTYGNGLGAPDLVVGIADAPGLFLKVTPRKAGGIRIGDAGGIEQILVVKGHVRGHRIGYTIAFAVFHRIIPPVGIEIIRIEVGLAVNVGLYINELVVAAQIQDHGFPTAHHVGQVARGRHRRNLGVEFPNDLDFHRQVGIGFVERIQRGLHTARGIMTPVPQGNGFSHGRITGGCFRDGTGRQETRHGSDASQGQETPAGEGKGTRHDYRFSNIVDTANFPMAGIGPLYSDCTGLMIFGLGPQLYVCTRTGAGAMRIPYRNDSDPGTRIRMCVWYRDPGPYSHQALRYGHGMRMQTGTSGRRREHA